MDPILFRHFTDRLIENNNSRLVWTTTSDEKEVDGKILDHFCSVNPVFLALMEWNGTNTNSNTIANYDSNISANTNTNAHTNATTAMNTNTHTNTHK